MVIFQDSSEDVRPGPDSRMQRRNAHNQVPMHMASNNSLLTPAVNGTNAVNNDRCRSRVSRVCREHHGHVGQRPHPFLAPTGRQNRHTHRNCVFVRPNVVNVDHSGLQGCERPEEATIYSPFAEAMDNSGSPADTHNIQSPLDLSSFYSLDRGLENYGRYLGSSPEPGCFSDSNQRGLTVSNQRESTRNRDCDLNNGSLSDYAGLGRYSQPFFECDIYKGNTDRC